MGDEGLDGFALTAVELRKLIDRTRFAISTEETRYYLNGIFLHTREDDGGRLRSVATDGHRLARVEIALPEGAAGMPPVIVPRKTIGELRKLIENSRPTPRSASGCPTRASASRSDRRFCARA